MADITDANRQGTKVFSNLCLRLLTVLKVIVSYQGPSYTIITAVGVARRAYRYGSLY